MLPQAEEFLKETQRCVKCALCLPHCPTYQVSQQESRSPRGRIALMQALATEALPATPALQAHIDSCLTCRACESVCPAKVPYYTLLLKTRAFLATKLPPRGLTRLIGLLLARPRLRRACSTLLQWSARCGLWPLLARIPGLAALPKPIKMSKRRAAALPARAKVFLVTDCLQDLSHPTGVAQIIFVLESFGFQVEHSPLAHCCGAFAAHQGEAQRAAHLLAQLKAQWPAPGPYQAFISLSSGCGSYLQSQAALDAFPLQDLYHFLWQHCPTDIHWRPIAQSVGFFHSCTHRQMADLGAAQQLLGMIPNLQLHALPGRIGCCGAGGGTFLTHPAQGAALASVIGTFVSAQHLDSLLSTNLSCNIHLQRQLPTCALYAPIHFIAESLGFSSAN